VPADSIGSGPMTGDGRVGSESSQSWTSLPVGAGRGGAARQSKATGPTVIQELARARFRYLSGPCGPSPARRARSFLLCCCDSPPPLGCCCMFARNVALLFDQIELVSVGFYYQMELVLTGWNRARESSVQDRSLIADPVSPDLSGYASQSLLS
jgi:hypothetical protein